MITSGYLTPAFSAEYRALVRRLFARAVHEVDFDTVVATGTSGLLVAPALAAEFGKKLTVVRKPTDKAHSQRVLEGWHPGARLLFLDDLVESGGTFARVDGALRQNLTHEWGWAGAFLYFDELRHWRGLSALAPLPVYQLHGYVNFNDGSLLEREYLKARKGGEVLADW